MFNYVEHLRGQGEYLLYAGSQQGWSMWNGLDLKPRLDPLLSPANRVALEQAKTIAASGMSLRMKAERIAPLLLALQRQPELDNLIEDPFGSGLATPDPYGIEVPRPVGGPKPDVEAAVDPDSKVADVVGIVGLFVGLAALGVVLWWAAE